MWPYLLLDGVVSYGSNLILSQSVVERPVMIVTSSFMGLVTFSILLSCDLPIQGLQLLTVYLQLSYIFIIFMLYIVKDTIYCLIEPQLGT